MNVAWRAIVLAALLGAVGLVLVLKQSDKTSNQTIADDVSTPSTGMAADVQALPRLVDVGSDTCIPCKMMMPVLAELKAQYFGRLRVEFCDIREDPNAVQKYKIRVIPTQIFYDAAGQERFRHEGFISKDDILAKWRELGVDLAADPRTE
jgi:thioredoxin 1